MFETEQQTITTNPCNKGKKNHQAKEWRDTSTEAAPRSVRRERQEGRNSDRRGRKELRYTGRKRKALLRSREFAVAVGGAAAACWVVVVVGETKKGLRKEK